MQSVFLAVFLGLGFEGCMHPVASGRGGSNPLSRSYRVGDRERYEMTASHEDPRGVLRYSAVAATTAVRDTGGHFVENVDWSALIVNGSRTALTPANSQGVQWVTLDTAVIPRIPNLQAAHPSLIGPMLDLMTFYVDLQLAAKQPSLRRAGDRQYVHVNTPASWADGRQVIVGQDVIDFDITLMRIDRDSGRATLVVRHVPPEMPAISLPVGWMKERVGTTANNWVQVVKAGDAYLAAVGEETFDVTLVVSLADGRVISATMVNPVDVLERTCTDRALEQCGAGRRYRIARKVTVHSGG